MPEQSDNLNFLISTLVNANNQLSGKLDAAFDRMATKADIESLREELRGTVSRNEFNLVLKTMDDRISGLEKILLAHTTTLTNLSSVISQSQLPKWFWPSISSGLGLVSVIISILKFHTGF